MKTNGCKRFPNDRHITVLRPDLTTYSAKQSRHLMRIHGWSEVEVRVMQSTNWIGSTHNGYI